MFRQACSGYYTYAFPNDDLLPKNNSYRNTRNGWGLTAIDGLDTAIIMEQQDIVDIILDFVPTVDFTRNNAKGPRDAQTTSLFETNIRYLGGLLSSYDLLKGPFQHLVSDGKKVDALLQQAKTLADALRFCFNTPSGLPVNLVFLDKQTFTDSSVMQNGDYSAGLAEIGTLVLEWQRLSDLTGDPTYGQLAQRAESYWFNAPEVWPGLTGGNFSVGNGELIDDYGGWTSGNDSASPNTGPDLTMAGAFSGQVVQNYSEGLACFIGGSFILGSTALKNKHYLEPGLQFAEFCANGYRYAASGIGPSMYSWNETILSNPNYTNQTTQYERAGWFIPENLALGGGQAPEAYWRDVAWAYTIAQNKTLRVGSGFASISNVLEADGGEQRNFMASFMLAEVLKYQYLITAPKQGIWDVIYGEDKAHPIRVAARTPV
ncbi:Putative glycoside hydrolase family 47, six-hairpin glycosidase-like superfamily [Septoria linicola]|uniref:alpha-1,2-Mannosidase n=1 Tax=Septoria linicola TaxID=215465 RepID=A0A9Q9B4R8_9PEZI|nr:Putative glycoside hydrolase family 47, six-hairpin glycosidase-like superfamily [Septoria linicola]